MAIHIEPIMSPKCFYFLFFCDESRPIAVLSWFVKLSVRLYIYVNNIHYIYIYIHSLMKHKCQKNEQAGEHYKWKQKKKTYTPFLIHITTGPYHNLDWIIITIIITMMIIIIIPRWHCHFREMEKKQVQEQKKNEYH